MSALALALALGLHWKGVLLAGDDSTKAFDNARVMLRQVWLDAGLKYSDLRELSVAERGHPASIGALGQALRGLKIGPGDACFVYLTSHGAPWGFYLKDQPYLTPTKLSALLDETCRGQPTVVFVSACYSGIFDGHVMQRPNRVILTAARDDRTSFGCGVEDKLTYWDACVLAELPRAASWSALGEALQSCIRKKERAAGVQFSYPQAFIGPTVRPLPVPRPRQGAGK